MADEKPSGALSQLSALRDRLAAANPEFEAAARMEREAEVFCDKVRTDLKSHRLALGLHQNELAERVQLSQSAISKIENGRGDLNLKTVFRIAAALGFNPVVAFTSSTTHAVEAPATTSETAALVEAVQEDLIRQIPDIVQNAAIRLATIG